MVKITTKKVKNDKKKGKITRKILKIKVRITTRIVKNTKKNGKITRMNYEHHYIVW